MGASHYRLVVDKKTHDLVNNACVDEFIRHHPELEAARITQNMVIRSMVRFYLEN